MATKPVTESEVKHFIIDWFHKLDIHPPVEEMLPFVSNEKLSMKMPDRRAPFNHHDGFKEWYEGVGKYLDVVHTVKALNIQTSQDIAKVRLINRWERSVAGPENTKSSRAGFYVAQTWELERSPQSQRLFIVMYNVWITNCKRRIWCSVQTCCVKLRSVPTRQVAISGFPRQVTESGADSIRMLYRCNACDDYASWSNHRRIGRCTVHRHISVLALATRASGSPPHRTFLSRNRRQKLGECCRFHWRRLSRSVGPRSGTDS